MTDFNLTGGCQCGAVRYRLSGTALSLSHCHCSMCRKLHGALFVSYSKYLREHFNLESDAENLGVYESSAKGRRHFCKTCGCNVFAEDLDHNSIIFLAIGTLDDGAHPGHDDDVAKHIYYGSKVGWFDMPDQLPKLDTYD